MFEKLIGQSPNFEALLRSARMVAATDVTVLLCGETGTGKEILANALQQHSARSKQTFIALNCAALPESLAETELFGHRKGAFTGAVANQVGKLQAADRGTIFLDEVDSLPLALQAKLLRFLESGEVQPVGDTRTERLDVRVIAATNSDLHDKIARGEFRRDLYYRLNVVPLEIPPLRERGSDIVLLLEHYMEYFAREHGTPLSRFGKTALRFLTGYRWPGNVRELQNTIERAVILTEPNRPVSAAALGLPTVGGLASGESLLTAEPFDFEQAAEPAAGAAVAAASVVVRPIAEMEKQAIKAALRQTGGNRTKAADLLGISIRTLRNKLQEYRAEGDPDLVGTGTDDEG